jgi:hypothetical protein
MRTRAIRAVGPVFDPYRSPHFDADLLKNLIQQELKDRKTKLAGVEIPAAVKELMERIVAANLDLGDGITPTVAGLHRRWIMEKASEFAEALGDRRILTFFRHYKVLQHEAGAVLRFNHAVSAFMQAKANMRAFIERGELEFAHKTAHRALYILEALQSYDRKKGIRILLGSDWEEPDHLEALMLEGDTTPEGILAQYLVEIEGEGRRVVPPDPELELATRLALGPAYQKGEEEDLDGD